MSNNYKLLFVILYFIIFSTAFLIIVPVFEAPDENLHLDYINYVTFYKSIPNQYEGMENKEKFVGQGHQHPLYYLITGFINYNLNNGRKITINPQFNKLHIWNGGNEGKVPYYKNITDGVFDSDKDKRIFYFLRILSVLFGAVNLIFVYKISELFSENKEFSVFPVFILASLPQFAFISAMINNDNLAILLCTICLFLIIKMFKYGYTLKAAILLGIFLGLAILAKKTLLFLLPGLVIMFFYRSISIDKEYISFLKYLSIVLMITLLICGWYFIRNYILYSGLLGTQMEIDTMPGLVNKKSLFSYYFLNPFLPGLFHSFIGSFGWMNLKIPSYIYMFYALLGFIALLGYIKSDIIKKDKMSHNFILMILFIFLCLSGIIYFNLTYNQYQGRYMFPVASFIILILSFGLKEFAGLYKSHFSKNILIVFLVIFLVLFDVICLVVTYYFYYTPSNYL
jgi:4-amino-4-deoxy-L-arabinose transferase-like glycosyltransferase